MPRRSRVAILPGLALLVPLLVAVVASPAVAARKPKPSESLLQIVSPVGKRVPAHPHVNVIVAFGLAEGVPPDLTTFRARIGRRDLTSDFVPMTDATGRVTGMRARLERGDIKIGRRRVNRIRFVVEAQRAPGTKGKKVRDKDRIRFRAIETDNVAPVAILPESAVAVPELPYQFDATDSYDPEGDPLTYHWDFGDGTTSTEARPAHTYASDTGDVIVRLTVDDGQASASSTMKVLSVPPIPDGTTPGVVQITSETGLEFGPVPPGSSATRVFTIHNLDESPTGWVAARVGHVGPGFTVAPESVTLPPGESADVTVTFSPTEEGHRSVQFGIVANATNRNYVSFLAHGYGGTGAGTGPTLASQPLFYTDLVPSLFGFGVFAILPDGTRKQIDNGVHTCEAPLNGPGTGDFCVVNQDCAANGGTCLQSSTCLSGPNTGQPCSGPNDCPDGYCPAYALFDPNELCGDGAGGIYLLSDEGTFTDPKPAENELAVSVLRLSIDEQANVTDRAIIDRANTETLHIACDGFSAAAGGRVYLSEYRTVPDQANCFRTEKEALVAVRKSNGNNQTLMSRIDAAFGFSDCGNDGEDFVAHLESSANGQQVYASSELSGLWRIRPTPLMFTPDVDELFRLHPDGSVLIANTTNPTDLKTVGIVNLYRISPDQVQAGPLPLGPLAPCATFTVPNHGDAENQGVTGVISFAAAPVAPGSRDAIALVSVAAGARGIDEVLSANLKMRATLAFLVPADSNTCTPLGPINLEIFDQLTF
jgi:PKD repeat protein